MGVAQQKLFVMSKMVHTSKKNGSKSCKITTFNPDNYIVSNKDSKFEGFIPEDFYIDLALMPKINVGQENVFDFGLSDYGMNLKIINIIE